MTDDAPADPRGASRRGRAVLVFVVAVSMVSMTWTGVLAAPTDPPTPAAEAESGHGHDHVDALAAGGSPGAEAAELVTTGEVQVVPEATDGFALQPLAPTSGATVLSFGPSQDLFAATAGGQILRYATVWTQAGPLVQDVTVEASGFNLPQGLAFSDDGRMFVADVRDEGAMVADAASDEGNPADRPLGRVWEIDLLSGERSIIVDGVPNGQHNINHIRFGPDGLLYLPVGNPNDHGNGTGTGHTDIFPYSGAFLTVDVDGVDEDRPDTTPEDPAVLHWRDDDGERIPDDDIVDHPRNEDFAAKVGVFAFGFRNIFGITFAPEHLPFAGDAFTGTNGAQPPAASQDVVYNIEEGAHHGFPFCYDRGDPGATDPAITKEPNPESPNPAFPCEDKPTAEAMLGWHVCATGVDFPQVETSVPTDATFPEAFRSSLFVGECGPLDTNGVEESIEERPTTHNTGHKVARVPIDEDGNATGVEDFLTGLQAPTDVQFGPDGAMYVADADVIYRVFPTATPDAPEPTVAVAAAGNSFLPQLVVVPEGTTVTWVGDVLPHTVTSSEELCQPVIAPHTCTADDGEESFDESLGASPGTTVSRTFTEEGIYPYFCKIHAGIGMVGLVVVADPTDPGAVTAADVTDALEGLPG